MRNNTSHHPNNCNVFTVQLDKEHGDMFRIYYRLLGHDKSISEAIKTLLYPALEKKIALASKLMNEQEETN